MEENTAEIINNDNEIDSIKTNIFKKKSLKFVKTNCLSIIALVISILSFIVSFQLYKDEIRTGELIVHKPTGFCIIRGFPQFEHPSDYLVLTIAFENNGRGVKTIENMILSLSEKNKGLEIKYELAGIIPKLIPGEIGKLYEEIYGFSIPGHSVERYNLLFRNTKFWKQGNPNYNFHFKGQELWKSSLTYNYDEKNIKWKKGNNFIDIPIYETIDKLTENFDGYHADCFSFY